MPALGATLHITAPGGEGAYRVSGIARGAANRDRGQAAVFFPRATADTLSGAPGRVNAVGIIAKPGASLAGLERAGVDVLDHAHAADADAGDPQASDREAMVAIFGTMGGIAGFVALFVVAGTFALAIAQRRKETAVLRALGATPRQVRRLIATEALFVSLVAGALGLLAGRPLATALVDLLSRHGHIPAGFEPGHSWIPLVAALGMGVGIAQLAVVAAARRAGKVRPAEALREVAVEHGRVGWVRGLSGVLALGGGAAMALLFKGEQASAFSIIAGILLAAGTALLGRWLLGFPAALLARPLRALGPAGLLASTGLSANRWRTAALATPIVLIAMLVGTQGLLATSSRHDTEGVTAQRVTAEHVVTGRDGAPLPAGTAERLGGAGMVPTQVFLLGKGLTGWDAPWAAAGLGDATGALDLGVRHGDLDDVRGTNVAISDVVAAEGHVQVGDVLPARLEDTTKASLRVAAIYDRAAGLGHVVMDRGARPAPRRGPRRRGGVRGRQAPRGAPGHAGAHPRRVPRHRAHARPERRLGRVGDHRAVDRVRRARARQHRRHGHRRAPRRARHHPPPGRDALAGDPDGRARARPDRRRRAARRRRRRGGLGDGRARGRPRHRAERVRDARGRPGRGRRAARPRRRRGDRPQGDPRHARSGDAGPGVRMERMARSVLVVDDSAPFRATARALLEARGYRVVGAVADGGEALAAVEAMRPDAVLLDINLPDADGIAVAGRLTGAGGPAVVLVSTLDGAAMRGAIERSGARGFLSKADLTSPQLVELLGPP